MSSVRSDFAISLLEYKDRPNVRDGHSFTVYLLRGIYGIILFADCRILAECQTKEVKVAAARENASVTSAVLVRNPTNE